MVIRLKYAVYPHILSPFCSFVSALCLSERRDELHNNKVFAGLIDEIFDCCDKLIDKRYFLC